MTIPAWQFISEAWLRLAPGPPGAFSRAGVLGAINGPMWTITHEELCYLAVAALFAAGLFRNRYLVLAAFLTAIVLRFEVFEPTAAIFLRLDAWFLAGAVAFQFKDRITYSTLGAAVAIGVLVCLYITHRMWFGYLFPGAYLMLWFGFHPSAIFKNFGVFKGQYQDLSYGTYLYGTAAGSLAGTYLGVAGYGAILPTVMISLALAVASWFIVERRFLRKTAKNETRHPLLASANQ